MYRLSKGKTILLSILMIAILGLPVSADDLTDAIRKQQEILNQQIRAENQLKSLTTKAAQMEKQIQQLNKQVSAAELDVDKKEKAYSQSQEEVQLAERDVELKQMELESRQNALRSRVQTIYEDGQVSYLEVLFQATDLTDFLSRVEYMSFLVENDQNTLDDIRMQKEELNQQKETLTAKMAEAEQRKEDAEAAKVYLNQSKTKKQTALAENEKDQEALLIQIEKLEKDSKELEAKIRELQKMNTGLNGSIGVWPTPGYKHITSSYGYRRHPITRKNSLHTGVDIGAPNGAKTLATGSGVVIYSGWYGAYGNTVIIDHGNGLSSLYGHLSSRTVATGKTVIPGQQIGGVGSTGWSTGPHLHFEVRKDGVPTDPMTYFR